MNKEEIESPYCEICGHCGEICCCGIRNFIDKHIEGKTNCKNEGWVISNLIDLCEYKDQVFEENKQLKEILNEIKNIDIFKEFSFPLMKRWEEQQVLSSIDYQFKTTFIKKINELEKGE